MTSPTCDFYCDKILKSLLDVPVYFENERVFAFHHTIQPGTMLLPLPTPPTQRTDLAAR
jgi:hypothetical protein